MGTTWILIANATRARLYENTGIGKGLDLLEEFTHPESRLKGADLVSDRPGHMQSSGNGQGSRQPATSPRTFEAELFAREIAETLEFARAQNQFDRLILVAGTPFLGALRSQLSSHVLSRTSETLSKDYTAAKDKELGRHLEPYVYL